MPLDPNFWADRLAKKQEQLAALDDMFEAFAANGGIQEYDLDTSKGRQQVRRVDLTQWRLFYKKLEGDIAGLEARVCGNGVLNARGGW